MIRISYKIHLCILVIALMNLLYCGKIDDSTLFQIGDVQFTKNEYAQFINKRKSENRQVDNKSASPLSLDIWKNEFVNNAVMIAEAFKNRYHNDTSIDSMLNRMTRYMLFGENGPFIKEFISSNIQISDEMLQIAEKRQPKKYELEYFEFNSKNDFSKAIGDIEPINNISLFQSLANKKKQFPDIIHDTISWDWLSPKFPDLREQIFALEEGEVSSLLNSIDGYYMFFVRSKKIKKASSVDKERGQNALMKKLLGVEKQRLAYELDKQIYDNAEIRIDDSNVNLFWNIIRNEKIVLFQVSEYFSCADATLMTYSFENDVISVTTMDFMNYYNDLAVRSPLATKKGLYYYLKEIPWQAHAYKLAEEAGLLSKGEFATKQKQYRHRLMVNKLVRSTMTAITEENLLHVYENEIERYRIAEKINASIYYFSSRRDAENAWAELVKNDPKVSSKETLVKKLHNLEKNVWIELENKKFSKSVTTKILQIKDQTVGKPIRINSSRHIIVRNHKSRGSVAIPFIEVRKGIEKRLNQKQFDAAKQQIASALSKKYRTEIDHAMLVLK